MDYIDRIKLIKSEKKITNDALSEMTGIPLGTLSKILAGISDSPSFQISLQFAMLSELLLNTLLTEFPRTRTTLLLIAERCALLKTTARSTLTAGKW